MRNSIWNFLLTPTLQMILDGSNMNWKKYFLHCLIWKFYSLVVKTLMNFKIIHQLLLNQNSSNTYTRYKSLKCPICTACPFTRVYECYFTYTPSLTPNPSNRKFKCTYQSHVFFKSFFKSMSYLVMSVLSLKNKMHI